MIWYHLMIMRNLLYYRNLILLWKFHPITKHSVCCPTPFAPSSAHKNTYSRHRRDDIKFPLFNSFQCREYKDPYILHWIKDAMFVWWTTPKSISRNDYEKSPGFLAISSKLSIFSAWKVYKKLALFCEKKRLEGSISISRWKHQYVKSADGLDT